MQGRYSVVGARPSMEIVAKENKVTVMDHVSGHLTEEIVDDPMVIPRKISQEWRPVLNDQLPDAFCGKSYTIIAKHVYQDGLMSIYDSINKYSDRHNCMRNNVFFGFYL